MRRPAPGQTMDASNLGTVGPENGNIAHMCRSLCLIFSCSAALMIGCEPSVAVPADGSTSTGTSDDGSEPGSMTANPQPNPGTGPTPTTAGANPSTTSASDGSDAEASDDGDDGIFLIDPDVPVAIECSILGDEAECPEGFKCAPWANDGSSSWNATRCIPIAKNPASPGDPCTISDTVASGEDDCDATSVCWDADPRTLEGTCFAFCIGTPSSPSCADENSWCSIGGDTVAPLCLPQCDPVAQDCAAGQGCYPADNVFACAPDASGSEGNPYDACEFINGCTPGTACLNGGVSELCDAGPGCCIPYCDLTNPICPDKTICEPWFAEGTVPDNPNASNIGVCIDPP